jgi:hypothetical protein
MLLHDTIATVVFSGHGRTANCQGMVLAVRGASAYVATAKHCVQAVSVPNAFTTTTGQDPDARFTVTYADGSTGRSNPQTHFMIVWHPTGDDTVVVATFTRRPPAYEDLCPQCRGLLAWGPGPSFRVMSVLASGGGEPVLSAGLVLPGEDGQWMILLPAAPGTSGAPVLDELGNLVGIASTGYIGRGGAQAGFAVTVVPGSWVLALARWAEEQNADLAQPPAPPPPPVATPQPPRPISLYGTLEGYVIRVIGDLVTFRILPRNGQPFVIVASPNCGDLKENDPVHLAVSESIVTIISSPARLTCSLHVVTRRSDTTDPQPSLPLPPTGAYARVLRVSGDQTVFIVMLDQSGRQVYLETAGPSPCLGIHENDQMLLTNNAVTDTVRMSMPDETCVMRVTEVR